MFTLMARGGFPMYFVLGFGLIALAAAARFALVPRLARISFVHSMASATLWATLTCMTADLATVFTRLPQTQEWMSDPHWHFILIMGLGESLSPCIIGFALLALTSLLIAVGQSREPLPA